MTIVLGMEEIQGQGRLKTADALRGILILGVVFIVAMSMLIEKRKADRCGRTVTESLRS